VVYVSPLGSGRISWRAVFRARGAHAFVGKGAQTGEVAVLFGRVVPARGGPIPGTTGREEPVRTAAPEALIEVQQRADGPALVVEPAGLRKIAVQVDAQKISVGGCLEPTESKTVASARVDQFALEQQSADAVTKLRPTVQADQPGGGQTGAPLTVE
jgi:hypothetical protein